MIISHRAIVLFELVLIQSSQPTQGRLRTSKAFLPFSLFVLSNRLKLVTRRQLEATSSWVAPSTVEAAAGATNEEKVDEDQQGLER